MIKPSELGVTVRTKAQSASIFEIQEEIEELYRNYKEVIREGKFSLNPKRLLGKGDLINKIIRDDIDAYTSSIIVDSIEDYERIKDSISNSEYLKVILYDDARSLLIIMVLKKKFLALEIIELI